MPKAPAPRLVFVRHGQTAWSKTGQHTSRTDLPLTEYGVHQMRRTGVVVFKSNFVDPEHITYVFVSPRLRAHQTVNLVLESLDEKIKSKIRIIEDDDIREWDYGDYEGLRTAEINAKRAEQGLDKERPWLIWKDGCENGETPQDVGLRLSRFIARVQALHKNAIEKDVPSDILVFAHGHSLRYLAALWFKLGVEVPIDEHTPKYVKSFKGNEDIEIPELKTFRFLIDNPNFLLEAGGAGVLSYAHHNMEEPALSLSGSFVLPPEESSD